MPLGVIGIIYESRPNVTADAGALCLKSGNAVILRGGSESAHSSARPARVPASRACAAAGLPRACIQLVPTTDRAAVGYLLAGMSEYLDVIVPRGGKALVERVQREARVPVIGHLEGNCHVYVDRDADLRMARAIALNAKMRRTGICGAAETLLVDAACVGDAPRADRAGPARRPAARCAATPRVQQVDPRVRAATRSRTGTPSTSTRSSPRAWSTGVDAAIAHIARYGSAHTECDRHRQRAPPPSASCAGRQRHRAAQRLDAVRRRR